MMVNLQKSTGYMMGFFLVCFYYTFYENMKYIILPPAIMKVAWHIRAAILIHSIMKYGFSTVSQVS